VNLNIFQGNDIISIISLCYVIILAKQNTVICENKNKFYIISCILTILIIILEVLDRYTESLNGTYIVYIHILINILGFSLIPTVPFILIFSYYNGDNKLYNSMLVFPLIINFVICIISGFNGCVFLVDLNNQYLRGPLFVVPVIIGMLYFILLIMIIKKETKDYGKDERIFLYSILFVVACSCIAQIFLKNLYIVWSSVSFALVLNYIFLRDLQIKYDPITGIKNRFAYEIDLKKYKNNENVAVVMFDLNNLKLINDKKGHCNGDKVINASARIIKDSFKGVGVPYRIGGDEFCVICINVSKNLIDESLSQLTNGLEEVNKSSDIKIGLAFGYSFFKDSYINIYDVVENADIAMYKHKAILKKEAI